MTQLLPRPAARPFVLASLALSSITLLGACSGGGSGSSGSTTTTANLLITSTGSTSLFALEAEVEEVRLVRDDGARSENLLSERASLELVGQTGSASWLVRDTISVGAYDALEITFDPSTVLAADGAGARTPLPMGEATVTVDIAPALEAQAGRDARVTLEIDLGTSVVTDPVSGASSFAPDLEAFLDRATPVEGVLGALVEAAPAQRSLTVDATQSTSRLGAVGVELDDDTMLLDLDGTPFASEAAFQASVRAGVSVLRVGGVLDADGRVAADEIRIGGPLGGPTLLDTVRIEGQVLHVDDRAGFFVLLMRRIEEGAAEARPALAAIGNPSSIDVHFDGQTVFELPGGQRVRASDLGVGQIVDVEFQGFDRPPFRADRVELRSQEVCFAATVTGTNPLRVRVDDDSFLVSQGLIASARTEIEIDLTDAEVRLGMHGQPTLSARVLGVGAKVGLCGELEGGPRQPVLRATSVDVHPGHLIKGTVEQERRQRSTFVVGSGRSSSRSARRSVACRRTCGSTRMRASCRTHAASASSTTSSRTSPPATKRTSRSRASRAGSRARSRPSRSS